MFNDFFHIAKHKNAAGKVDKLWFFEKFLKNSEKILKK